MPTVYAYISTNSTVSGADTEVVDQSGNIVFTGLDPETDYWIGVSSRRLVDQNDTVPSGRVLRTSTLALPTPSTPTPSTPTPSTPTPSTPSNNYGTPVLSSSTYNSITLSLPAGGPWWVYLSLNSSITNADNVTRGQLSGTATLRQSGGWPITPGSTVWIGLAKNKLTAGETIPSSNRLQVRVPTQQSSRQRTFYRRGTSAPSRPTSNAFSAYSSLSGWSTTNPGATATQDVYSVTLTQTFSSGTQNSSTFTGNTWGSVLLVDNRTGVTVPRLTGVFLGSNGFVISTNTTDNYYATFQYDDNSSFSSPVTVYDTTLGQSHQTSLVPQSARTGTVYVRGRLTTAARDGGTRGPWSATASRTFTATPTPSTSVPATPERPRLTARNSSGLIFRTDTVPGATRYRWRISSNATVSNADEIRETTGPSITILGLSPGTQRWVDVRAENSAGNSSYSADATGTTTRLTPTPPPTPPTPPRPERGV